MKPSTPNDDSNGLVNFCPLFRVGPRLQHLSLHANFLQNFSISAMLSELHTLLDIS